MRTQPEINRKRLGQRRRRGNILVLSALLMILMAGFVAFAVDLGSLYVARTELQRAADAAALSGAWELIDDGALSGNGGPLVLEQNARNSALQFASLNTVLTRTLSIPTSDIEVGFVSSPTDPASPFLLGTSNTPNAVRVHVRRTDVLNGPISFGFARVLGFFDQDVSAQATATLLTNFEGFRAPRDGSNLGILPIALDEETCNALLCGTGTDNWTWNEQTDTVSPGSDGIKEVNLYPTKTGSPGNRGTVDIGSNNNSTSDLSRQIRDGVTSGDLAYHGGELRFDSQGRIFLNGDTGISAGIKDDLQSIIGKPRMIPIFRQVVSPGNNATYTIVKFIGIRILDVKLTGSQSSKYVYVQPATMVARGAIPSTTPGRANYIYSNVWLRQ